MLSAQSVGLDIWRGQERLWSNTAGVGTAADVGTAAVVALPVAATLDAPALLGSTVGRLLWSGPGNMTLATGYASMSYGTTLIGKAISILGNLGVINPFPLWEKASAALTAGVRGLRLLRSHKVPPRRVSTLSLNRLLQ